MVYWARGKWGRRARPARAIGSEWVSVPWSMLSCQGTETGSVWSLAYTRNTHALPDNPSVFSHHPLVALGFSLIFPVLNSQFSFKGRNCRWKREPRKWRSYSICIPSLAPLPPVLMTLKTGLRLSGVLPFTLRDCACQIALLCLFVFPAPALCGLFRPYRHY